MHLDEYQHAAVTAPIGRPLLVVAGPGSGKTRVLTHRIAHLVGAGAAPWSILAVTFTNKAAAEMRERAGALGVDAQAAWIATFHSACARILRRWGTRLGWRDNWSIIDADDARRLMRDALREAGVEVGAAEIATYHAALSRAKNEGDPDVQLGRDDLAGEAARRYEAAKLAAGLCDFDDLLSGVDRLLADDEEVLARLHGRVAHVLVDEFQDTNVVQYRIVSALAAPGRSLGVVGDQDQSLYSWRAARPDLLDRFTADWPDASVVVLERNYRSTPQICDVARAVIAPNPARWRSPLRCDAPDGEAVRVHIARDDWDEIRACVDGVAADLATGRSCAVLVRTNAQTRGVEEELVRRAIPYSLIGTLRFYERAEVKDALAYLRLVVNPFDVASWRRAAAVPRRGLGAVGQDAVVAAAAEAGVSLIEAAELVDGRAGAAARALGALVQAAADVYDEDGLAAALRVVLAGGVADHHARGERGDERLENLTELVNAATEADGTGLTIAEWLEEVALVGDEAAGGGVQVMSIHAAKGKEWDAVWVLGLEEELLPHVRALDEGGRAALAEERRLAYVAVSRARHRLTLSWARQRRLGREPVPRRPSRFLDDLAGLVEVIEAPAASLTPPPWIGARVRRVPGGGPRLTPGDVAPGASVRHAQFGVGTVVALDAERVRVAFADKERDLLWAYAPLRLHRDPAGAPDRAGPRS